MRNREKKNFIGSKFSFMNSFIRTIGLGNILSVFIPKSEIFELRSCFLIILIFFTNTDAYTQNNERKRFNTPTILRLNCKNLTSFPDTIKHHYDWIDISNVKDNLSIDEKCRKSRNTISYIPIEKLSKIDSTKIAVDKDYFHMECAALINDSLNGKVQISYFSNDLFKFNSLDSQNLYSRDIGYIEDSTGFLFLPNESDYGKIAAGNSDKTCYVLSYSYNLSGIQTMSVVISLYSNGSCLVSPLLVNFKEPLCNINRGCFGVYEIRGSALLLALSYGYSMKFRLRKDNSELHVKKIKFENFKSAVLSKRNAIFFRQ